MRADGNFDLVGKAFEADVYGTSKGLVRLTVLWNDLLAAVPRLTDGGLKILDAGGGAGHLAIRLAQLGHQIVLAEPARDMRERAEAAISAAGLGDRITLVPATLQESAGRPPGCFDVIICHAVLEWLADPRQGLKALVPLLAADGQL
jgi:tRNA 5-carboxymethoxyuridine methyltransferase